MKKISVVVPTYNRGDKIADTLERLAKQSIGREKYEVIVADNNSQDDTRKVVERFCKKYPDCFFYVLQKKRGAAANRNMGFSKTRADIVLFLDDDMLANKNLLREHLKAHSVFDGSVLGYFEMRIKGDDDNLFQEYLIESGNQNVFPFEDRGEVNYHCFYTGNVSVRRKVFEKLGGFDERFKVYGVEDIDLGYRLWAYGEKCYFWKKAFSYHEYYPDYETFISKRNDAGYSLAYFLDKYSHIDRYFKFEPRPLLTLGGLNLACKVAKPFLFARKHRGLSKGQYHYYHWTIRWNMYKGFLKYKRKMRRDKLNKLLN